MNFSGASAAKPGKMVGVPTVNEISFGDRMAGAAAGELLARAKQDDVIDAALGVLANDGDRMITSDPADLAPLAPAADVDVEPVTP